MYDSQEAKGGIAKGEGARANEQQLPILLLRARLVVIRELGFLWHSHFCSVCLVVQGQGCVGVFEIVEGFVLFAVLLCNPVQELRAILLVLGVVPLILLKGQVVPLLFIQRGLTAVAGQGLRELVATDESGRVEHGPANHDSDRRHRVYVWFTCWLAWLARSHIGREYLLVLEILLQGDAARHNGCELDVVHDIGTGVFGQVFFYDLAANPTNPRDKACDSCGVEKRFHELVVRHGGVYIGFSFRLLRLLRLVALFRHCALVLLGQLL